MFSLIGITALKWVAALSANIVSLPCLVTSRSNKKVSNNSGLTIKQSLKLSLVERVIYNISIKVEPVQISTVSKLDKFLNAEN